MIKELKKIISKTMRENTPNNKFKKIIKTIQNQKESVKFDKLSL